MRFRREKENGKIEFQMAPMVDIVFLLIIFFMATTSFIVEESELKIDLPATPTTAPADELPDEVTIHVMEDGGVVVNEMEYDSPSSSELPELKSMLEKLSTFFKDQNVIINAHDYASHGRVVEVLNACVASGIMNISFYIP